ncbi:MAG TPA: PAS domain S-box protein [Candidatus Acidoferrales bacterium]|nr:PAS domain S-box protein [Candidatus Acidoferrales bacterium]
MAFKTKFAAALIAALAVLAAVGVLSYRQVLQEDSDQSWVSHTHQVLENLDVVSGELIDAETAQRGYILTGDAIYFGPYKDAIGKVQSQLHELGQLVADNPVQVQSLARLTSLISMRLAEVADAIAVRKEKGLVRGAAAVRANTAKQRMDQIRSQLGFMKQREQQLLAERLAAATSSSRKMKAVILFGDVLALILLLAAGLFTRREMSRRELAEHHLRESDARYRLLFDSNPQPVWVYDSDTLAILDVNQSAIQSYGYSHEEFISLTIKDIRPPEDVPNLLENITKSQWPLEQRGVWRHRRKLGSTIDVEVVSHPLIYSGKQARLVVATDITARKFAEEVLRQSEERFRLLVSNVRDYAILMLDPQGRIVSWNEGAERTKGYAAQEIIGKDFSCFYPEDDMKRGKPAWALKQAAERGHFEDEGWRVRKDGSRFWASVVITALRDDAGRLRGFAKVTRDITERKHAEQEILRRSAELEAANKELEAFCYSVSHDLRAPLRGIDGFSQALLEDYAPKLDAQAKDYIQRVRSGTQRMGSLIDDLLNLSRITRAELSREPVDLTSLARSVAAELRRNQPGRAVEFIIAPDLRAVGDSRLVHLALENLLGNAWKFSSRSDHPRIEFGRAQNNGTSAFFVRDNGAGYDPAYADRLFGVFQRLHSMTDFPGTGVGLASVQRIILRHGGKVWAEGSVGQGATFYFTLGSGLDSLGGKS